MAGEEEEGAGTCGAWLERIQISSQAASVSHPPSPPHRLPHSVMHGERGCDVTMSRVSPGPHCHNVLVCWCAGDAASSAGVGRGMGSGGRCGDFIRAGAGFGMYRSMTQSHASLETRAGKHHPRTPALASHVGLIITVQCVPRIDILFGASAQSRLLEIVERNLNPGSCLPPSFSFQTIRSQV